MASTNRYSIKRWYC